MSRLCGLVFPFLTCLALSYHSLALTLRIRDLRMKRRQGGGRTVAHALPRGASLHRENQALTVPSEALKAESTPCGSYASLHGALFRFPLTGSVHSLPSSVVSLVSMTVVSMTVVSFLFQ